MLPTALRVGLHNVALPCLSHLRCHPRCTLGPRDTRGWKIPESTSPPCLGLCTCCSFLGVPFSLPYRTLHFWLAPICISCLGLDLTSSRKPSLTYPPKTKQNQIRPKKPGHKLISSMRRDQDRCVCITSTPFL